jgi:hypothetical protein
LAGGAFFARFGTFLVAGPLGADFACDVCFVVVALFFVFFFLEPAMVAVSAGGSLANHGLADNWTAKMLRKRRAAASSC